MTSEFVLLIGDFHIPNKAADLPDEFKELLVPGPIGHVICTGNIGNKETWEKFKNLSSNFTMVRGDCDDVQGAPLSKCVEINGVKFGVIHGHQCIPWDDEESLKGYQRELGCDILVHGHTHTHAVKKFDGKYFMNPGSATGAFSSLNFNNKPSFILVKVEEGRKGMIFEYVYDSTGVKKVKINKNKFEL